MSKNMLLTLLYRYTTRGTYAMHRQSISATPYRILVILNSKSRWLPCRRSWHNSTSSHFQYTIGFFGLCYLMSINMGSWYLQNNWQFI